MRIKNLAFAISALGLIGAIVLLTHLHFKEQRAVLARSSDGAESEVLVIAESTGLFEWEIQLCWRISKGPWMTYLLDGDADFWRNVALTRCANLFEVRYKQTIAGQLDTKDGSFNYPARRLRLGHPNAVVLSDNPFDRSNRIDCLSVGWDSVWPSTFSNSGNKTNLQSKSGSVPNIYANWLVR